MNPVNSSAQFALRVAMLLLIFSTVHASEVSDTKDEVTLSVKCEVANNGNNHISCTILNNSSHLLGMNYDKGTRVGLQFKLFDDNGIVVPQKAVWARDHAQEGTDLYERPRGQMGYNLRPLDRTGYAFDLEDAYGDSAVKGRKLEVTWNSWNYWADLDRDVPAGVDSKGNPVKAHKEKVHFPPGWKLSVALSIPNGGHGESSIPNTTEEHPITPSTQTPVPEPPADKLSSNKSSAQNPPSESTQSLINPWWWGLIAIPLLLFAWLGLRLRKQQ